MGTMPQAMGNTHSALCPVPVPWAQCWAMAGQMQKVIFKTELVFLNREPTGTADFTHSASHSAARPGLPPLPHPYPYPQPVFGGAPALVSISFTQFCSEFCFSTTISPHWSCPAVRCPTHDVPFLVVLPALSSLHFLIQMMMGLY